MNYLSEILTVLVFTGLFWQLVDIRRSNQRLRQELARHAEAAQLLDGKFTALVSCSRTLGDRFGEVERNDRALQKQIDTLKASDEAGSVAVEHAMKLIEKGSKMEEVTDVCDLTHGEVEILRSLSRYRSAA